MSSRPRLGGAAAFGTGSESNRRETVICSVLSRQLKCLSNMIELPLLGVVKAASAV